MKKQHTPNLGGRSDFEILRAFGNRLMEIEYPNRWLSANEPDPDRTQLIRERQQEMEVEARPFYDALTQNGHDRVTSLSLLRSIFCEKIREIEASRPI